MEELSMILLTVPVFFPLVVGLGFDPVWFGIIIVVVVQIGLISPSVGMNLSSSRACCRRSRPPPSSAASRRS
jgi:TRAP-type C4-dicarboxylate transport system permease large subunit